MVLALNDEGLCEFNKVSYGKKTFIKNSKTNFYGLDKEHTACKSTACTLVIQDKNWILN